MYNKPTGKSLLTNKLRALILLFYTKTDFSGYFEVIIKVGYFNTLK